MSADTLERIIPDLVNPNENTGSETLQLHMERYKFAVRNLNPGRVLDMACGVGYGSYYAATEAGSQIEKIIAVDISADAIEYARSRYAHPKIEFICADATTYSPSQKFDTIISLETIEHIPAPEKFIAHLKSLLNDGGVIIGSVPVTPSVDANPHHLTDFTTRSFRRIFTQLGFEELNSFSQVQPFSPFRIVTKQETRMQHMRQNLLAYYVSHPLSFFKRIFSTLTDGFNNRYLIVAWRLK